jgi:predicted GIY-YIG superfamily endonuclease
MVVYVYFIQAGKRGPVKIGVATDVEKRLESLQTGNHQELHIRTLIVCDEKNHAFETEKKFHRRFKHFHIRGEWFYGAVLDKKIMDSNRQLDIEHLSQLQNMG